MDMKIIGNEKQLCICCMEEHDVKTVLIHDQAAFKDVTVAYDAIYQYCDQAEELYENEQQIRDNDLRLKDAYRMQTGLLTSKEIIDIRSKYGITQGDLCTILGWGQKTLTRYEGHQVQDKAHDEILRKVNEDPEWFLSLLMEAQDKLPKESYLKYWNIATLQYENAQDSYLRKSIEASYARLGENPIFNGNMPLSLDKTIDVIRYFASSVQVKALYTVKLMKMLWYGDFLSYKKRQQAITGLVYLALPMGAVPVGYNNIINLQGVPYEEVDFSDGQAYYFHLEGNTCFPTLSDEEMSILDIVINKFGNMSKSEIVNYMHKERAYIETAPKNIIQYKYAKDLHI